MITFFSKHLAKTSNKWSEGLWGLHTPPRALHVPMMSHSMIEDRKEGAEEGQTRGEEERKGRNWKRRSKLIPSLPVAL